jgi:signal transduction histidine kinase
MGTIVIKSPLVMSAARSSALPMDDDLDGHIGGSPMWPRVVGSAALGAVLLIWVAATLVDKDVRLLIHFPALSSDIGLATGVLRLFAALVLLLFPAGAERLRLRWVAVAFAVLGSTTFVFEFLQPIASGYLDLSTSIYAVLTARSIVGLLLLIGLVPRTPPRLPGWLVFTILPFSLVITYGAQLVSPYAPRLASAATWDKIQLHGSSSLLQMTPWNWTLGLIPVLLLLGAIAGEIRRPAKAMSGTWLLPALVVLEGAFVHEILWPSSYGAFITSAKVLTVAFSVIIAIGSIVDLHRIAVERQFLLDAEIKYSQQLAQIAALKADFTAMVAHELASPVGAIRNFATLLQMDDIDSMERQEALEAISSEARVLSALVQDVQSAGEVERLDFSVHLRPHRLSPLLAGLARFGNAQRGHHPTTVLVDGEYCVLVDENRLGQVLHNLVSNAAKYSSDDAPIDVRASRVLDCVRIEVIDHGYGIRPEDMSRIFEKFGRGKDELGRQIPGAGLGLYVSRHILLAHGADLAVESIPGKGSTFSFELELIS